MRVTRTLEIDDMTPQELASIFARWFADEQAAFFSAIAVESKDWPGTGWCQQACAIAEHLDDAGRSVIEKLAGHAGLIPESEA